MKKGYYFSHRVMIQASHTITSSFNEFLSSFEQRNSNLNANYCTDLKNKINTCFSYIGLDLKTEHKDVSMSLTSQMELISNESKLLRSDVKFALRKNLERFEILNSRLRLTQLSTCKSHDSIFSALTFFINEIIDFETEMISYGIDSKKISNLKAIAATFIETYKNQDLMTSRIVNITSEQQIEFNLVYNEISSICEYGKSIFKSDRSKAKLFSLYAIAKTYMISKPKKKTEEIFLPTSPDSTLNQHSTDN